MCDQWLDYDTGDTKVDRVLDAEREMRPLTEIVTYTAVEHHLWLSVFMRPMRSNFSRLQRLSCLLGLIYITMIICTMIIKTPDTHTNLHQVTIGVFRFSLENFEAALVAVSISTLIIWLVVFFFKNSQHAKSSNFDGPFLRAYRKLNSKVSLDKSFLGKPVVPPAERAVHHQYHILPHFTVYVGWAILITAVAVASYLLLSFSDDWKEVKSEIWMTTIFVALLCSFLITEMAKVKVHITPVVDPTVPFRVLTQPTAVDSSRICLSNL